jgi:hypothetical protein
VPMILVAGRWILSTPAVRRGLADWALRLRGL